MSQDLMPSEQQAMQSTPSQMIAYAMANNADISKLEQLYELQKRFEEREAEKAYILAMAEFKTHPPAIYKDKKNKQYDSMYTSIGNLVNTVNEAMGPHGFSSRWDIQQGEKIVVKCILTHRGGHSESCTMSGLPDGSGSKNPLQQIKSTVTYLKLATFEAVTGMASEEGNLDDDGNEGGNKKEQSPAVSGVRKGQLSETAALIRDYIADDKDWDAFGLYEPITDNDEKLYIWPLLPSNVRSALKRCAAEKEKLANAGASITKEAA